MEEQWIRIDELQEVDNLVTQKYSIEQTKKYWEELLNQYKIDYRFDLEAGNEGKITVDAKLGNTFTLVLYIKKDDLENYQTMITDLETAQNEIPWELREEEEEE